MPDVAKNHDDPHLREKIRERLRRLGRPTTEKDLIKQLRVKGDDRKLVKRIVADMLSKGELASTRAGRIGLSEKMDLVAGRLEVKRGGFGFVIPGSKGKKGSEDIYISSADMADALHGDRVLVHIEGKGQRGQPEGRIVEVLERRSTTIVGRLESESGGARVVPFDPRLLHDVFLTGTNLLGAKHGEMVVVEITRYPTPHRSPMGQIVEVLGSVDLPGVDVKVVLEKFGIADAFPEDVLEEAESISDEVAAEAIEGREDFRDRPIVTIDGETARDFDDAVEVEVLENGSYRLGVHIADVSHYVKEGSRLDEEAFVRGTSVYFPDRAVPMLPERLSNGICSLRPGVDRLVQSVYVDVSPAGEVGRARFADGVIRSAARMTYTKVFRILEGDKDLRQEYASLLPSFERMHALYKVLRARREARGSIDFDRPDAEVVLDEKGRVTEIRAEERNVAHRIIEEFMLLANETVAAHFANREAPSIYRVHDEPDEDRVSDFEDFILGFGYRLRADAEKLHPKMFQRLLARVAGKREERLISYSMLRTMKKAAYVSDDTSHYALAAPFYTHFTSPIRRYPDLVVHRLLRRLLKGSSYEPDRLDDIAEHSSITERRAEEAERELVEWKKVRFMADKVGDVFDGFVTGVTGFGLYVELVDVFVEGLVHISTLVDDYYHFNEKTHTLRGDSTGKRYRLGDAIEVQLVRANLADRQLDFAIEGLERRDQNRRRTKHR